MEYILYCKDLYAPIDGDKSKPKDMSEAELKIFFIARIYMRLLMRIKVNPKICQKQNGRSCIEKQ